MYAHARNFVPRAPVKLNEKNRHMTSAIMLFNKGLSQLWRESWDQNPWSAPAYMLEAFAGIGVVGKWASQCPYGTTRVKYLQVNLPKTAE